MDAEQLRIKAKCYHPSGTFEVFRRENIEKSIPELFEKQVRAHPDRLAIKTRSREITYSQLNNFANCVARRILAKRDEGEEPIALLLEHGAAAIAAIMGILKSGKSYVPLDPSLPKSRIDFILRDSQTSLIVTNKRNLSLAAELTSGLLPILNIDNLDAGLVSDNPELDILPDTLAYMIYTSGSTGQPKGVMDNHRNLLHETMMCINDFHLCKDDRLTLLHSFYFYVSVKSILPALLSGASLFILDVQKEGVSNLADWLIHNEITVSSANLLLRECVDDLTGPEQFPNLRLVSMGGDTVYKRDVERYKKYLSQNTIMHVGLASTEAKIITRYFIDKETEISNGIVPVGYAIDDKEVSILNEEGEVLGNHEVGEIAVKSRYLAPGYWKNPELTKAKFLPDPCGGEERIYHTGDLGRMLPNGCIFHHGRKDFFVKIRGYSIETAEIETALLDIETINKAVVVARKDDNGDNYLAAYVVPSVQPAPTMTELRRALSEKLPKYMLPSIFVTLTSLPRTSSGKVDRLALPTPERVRTEPVEESAVPRDELELRLTKTWEKVLGIHPIGVRDNFFELGGHSLLAFRLCNLIEKALGKDLPLATLFEAPTVRQLAGILREQGFSAPWSSLEAVEQDGAGSAITGRRILRYIPSKSRPYLKQQYLKMKRHPGCLYLKRQHLKARRFITGRFLSYGPDRLEEKLREMGLREADTVYMHSAFNAFNGFSGGPQKVIDCILDVIGSSGNLLMVSMPYTGTTDGYLRTVKTFDVVKTESSMGIISEIFRRKRDVLRSLNPAHPCLAFGPDAKWVVSDHEKTMYSCGQGSPFEKILDLNAKGLLFDVSFSTMTFFHFLEDRFKDYSPVELYDDDPLESTVMDSNGKAVKVKTYVFSKEARERRSSRIIERELKKKKRIKADRIGNTKLILVNLSDVLDCAKQIIDSGRHFYNA